MLEKNNIYLGDSYELIKQVEDKSVDLIIIDPPYQIEGDKAKVDTVYNKLKNLYKL